MMRAPALALLVALVVGLIAAERWIDVDPPAEAAASLGGPVAAVGSGESSTWYCAAGFSTPDTVNDHLIVITNTTAEPVEGALTVYPSLPTTLGESFAYDRVVQAITVDASRRQVVSLAPIVAAINADLASDTGSFAAALVEFDAGGVTVEHALVTPAGRDQAPCATSASTNWWFASGTTTNDVTYQLYLLNPFPEDAVVDITFLRDDGIREPSAFDGRLIPAHSVTMLDVTPVQPVLEQFATTITTRTGRVVAERVQLFRDDGGPVGVSLTPGANRLSDQWFFPAGAGAPAAAESYVIFNPNDEPAEVEFEIKPDSADRAGDIAPLGVAMGPNERWVVNVSTHPAHPVTTVATLDATNAVGLGERFFVSVRSFNDVPIVVERLLTRPVELGRGVTASAGLRASATAHTLAVPPWIEAVEADAVGARRGELAVLNPAGDTIARVEVIVGGEQVPTVREQVELAPRRRAAFDLNTLLRPGDEWIRVESSTGTMVELVAGSADGIAAVSAIPDAGTVSVPALLTFD